MAVERNVYSISEMVEMGYSRAMMYKAAHHRLAEHYMVRSSRRGKFFFDYEKFQKYKPFVFR